MNKPLLNLLLCLLLSYTATHAQKQDYVWLSGYDSKVRYDTTTNALYGATIVDFNYSPRLITRDSIGMNFDNTNVSICDIDGNLLFYSNGIYIANALDVKIDNSDSLNAGYFQYVWDPMVKDYGYRTVHGMLALENPAVSRQYYLLHTFLDSLPGCADGGCMFYAKSVYVTLLDMAANSGMGKVIYKNRKLFDNQLGFDIVATRHGNGRDWWAVVQKRSSNCYYTILIDDTGVNLVDSSCAGVGISFDNITSSAFSSNGEKYALLTYREGLLLFDFDRCTGTLTNSRFVSLPILQDSMWIGQGISFSPNNRYLYVNLTKLCIQYDTWAPDLAASADTVAVYDGFRSPFGSFFNTMQMGPDGKIYSGCGNGENTYHVIEYPDVKGDSCLFRQHGIVLPTFSGYTTPNFPNYRLGALPGSPCDTLTGLGETERAEKERTLKAFPNPAIDFITIDYGFTDWNKGRVDLEIVNNLGEIVYSQQLPMYSGFQQLNVSHYSAGMYNAYIKRGNQVVSTTKFAKQ